MPVSILIVLDVILEAPVCALVVLNVTSFNPYCVGCNLRSFMRVFGAQPSAEFQSLLCWM